MAPRLTVVVSQGRSNHPQKRQLEEQIVAQLLGSPRIEVTVIPHLYDLQPEGTGVLCLRGISGSMVVLSWLYPRAAFWVLDRHGIRGHRGQTQLRQGDDSGEEEDFPDESPTSEDPASETTPERGPVPDRWIYCLDLRVADDPGAFVEEIHRIAQECSARAEQQSQPSSAPTNGQGMQTLVALSLPAESDNSSEGASGSLSPPSPNDSQPRRVEESGPRRWYPVIDYSRCTNCLECLDFCLFGVYGVDGHQNIVVQQPDNCRKGCPACSRVCPAGAIIFPEHKTPAIAGADTGQETGLKIDLSKLFGAPDALELAVEERDRELVAAGREAVGMSVGVPKRQAGKPPAARDELDDLIDAVDELEL